MFYLPKFRSCSLVLFLLAFPGHSPAAPFPGKPSILLILADDLGYSDLGCYGQQKIKTPHLDRMAAGGLRFTQFYAGSTVCAPSRSVLMTGQHTGHTTVRGNAAKNNPAAQTLTAEEPTLPSILQAAGYRTGLIGKWGLGDAVDGPGHPLEKGFNSFFGYLDQTHAHNHYPDFLWRGRIRQPLKNDLTPIGTEGSGYSTNRLEFADDLFADEAVKFIQQEPGRPFFLCLSLVSPHANNERNRALKDGMEVPDYGAYASEPWTQPNKGQAASISRVDRCVGRLRETLATAGLEHNTLILFTSDNGPHAEGGNEPAFFQSSGPFRGIKRSLTEGGIRVPFIACLPGVIPPGTSGHAAYFGDLMATAAELAAQPLPPERDSLSLVPLLSGQGEVKKHEFLYWEFHEGGTSQALLLNGRWKALRLQRQDAPLEIYDLSTDPTESRNLASTLPEIVDRAETTLKSARRPNPHWPLRNATPAKR